MSPPGCGRPVEAENPANAVWTRREPDGRYMGLLLLCQLCFGAFAPDESVNGMMDETVPCGHWVVSRPADDEPTRRHCRSWVRFVETEGPTE